MFLRLWHDAFIRGNDHQYHIDTGRAGDHVFDKFFMSRHIDNTDCMSRRKRKRSKSQFDGDASCFFLFETVGIHAGQGLD